MVAVRKLLRWINHIFTTTIHAILSANRKNKYIFNFLWHIKELNFILQKNISRQISIVYL
jgi:hypothetical protein